MIVTSSPYDKLSTVEIKGTFTTFPSTHMGSTETSFRTSIAGTTGSMPSSTIRSSIIVLSVLITTMKGFRFTLYVTTSTPLTWPATLTSITMRISFLISASSQPQLITLNITTKLIATVMTIVIELLTRKSPTFSAMSTR